MKRRKSTEQPSSVRALTYQEALPISRGEAMSAFERSEVAAIADALVRVSFHDPDWRWAQGQCLEFLSHSDPGLRGVAATCLGHVARVHRQLDVDAVTLAIAPLLEDPKSAGRAADALEDIEEYARDA